MTPTERLAAIRRLCGIAGISINQFCKRAGVARANFSRWEQGTTPEDDGEAWVMLLDAERTLRRDVKPRIGEIARGEL